MELIEDDGFWFLTMELINGVDFHSFVENSIHRPKSIASAIENEIVPCDISSKKKSDSALIAEGTVFDESKLRKSLAGLCHGLSALHAVGEIHRDIKPSNVMVTEDNRVILCDFGLDTESGIHKQNVSNAMMGTAAYMAPEQAYDEAVGPQADWYAVGVMLYEALTNALPFEGKPLKII